MSNDDGSKKKANYGKKKPIEGQPKTTKPGGHRYYETKPITRPKPKPPKEQ